MGLNQQMTKCNTIPLAQIYPHRQIKNFRLPQNEVPLNLVWKEGLLTSHTTGKSKKTEVPHWFIRSLGIKKSPR